MTAFRNLQLTILLCLTAISLPAYAGSKDFGEIQVHYSVFPSTFLPAEVAKANNLRRSQNIGIVNIAIMEETEENGLKPVSGQVEGKVLNDVQQVTYLAFRRIQEGEAVYFIAEYQYSSGELMTFEITARPSGTNQELPVRFSQTLVDD